MGEGNKSKGPKWYVITGSPSSGVTSIIKYLERLGYNVVEEAARKIIDEEMAKGIPIYSVRSNERQFQAKVDKLKLKSLKSTPRNRIVFFDKGIPDSLAYYEVNGWNIDEILQSCQQKMYRKVFFLERLPYRMDYARIEDEEMVKKIGELSKKWYISLGYDVISIPKRSIKERANIILSQVDLSH